MATTKTTTSVKNGAKSASKKQNTAAKSNAQTTETKVVCPVCGSEFAIGEHEHQVENATVVGKDSGLGTVYLNVSKRGEALRAAGIDTSKYFSINLPTGGEQMMKMGDDGKAVPVSQDDPIIKAIMGGGTVPNRNLFRRWVMSQVFHGLQYRSGFTEWLNRHGYDYSWDMLVEELRVQAKLFDRDKENFYNRNRWFNQALCVEMADDYIKQLRKDISERKTHKCKGVPYIKFDGKDIFVADTEKKLIQPLMLICYTSIKMAQSPAALYEAVRKFRSAMYKTTRHYKQNASWKCAYKGMGAFATMQNLIRFHGCKFPTGNEFFKGHLTPLTMLDNAAEAYQNGDGWRLFGLMKQMLEFNHIDIDAKMKEWAAKK